MDGGGRFAKTKVTDSAAKQGLQLAPTLEALGVGNEVTWKLQGVVRQMCAQFCSNSLQSSQGQQKQTLASSNRSVKKENMLIPLLEKGNLHSFQVR